MEIYKWKFVFLVGSHYEFIIKLIELFVFIYLHIWYFHLRTFYWFVLYRYSVKFDKFLIRLAGLWWMQPVVPLIYVDTCIHNIDNTMISTFRVTGLFLRLLPRWCYYEDLYTLSETIPVHFADFRDGHTLESLRSVSASKPTLRILTDIRCT